jgi:hypothetical protein
MKSKRLRDIERSKASDADWLRRVLAFEEQGMTRSDAQSAADAEDLLADFERRKAERREKTPIQS